MCDRHQSGRDRDTGMCLHGCETAAFLCSILETSNGSAPTPNLRFRPQTSGLRVGWGGKQTPAPCPWLPCAVQELRVQRGPMVKGKEMSLQGPVLEIDGTAGPRTHAPKWEASGDMKGQLKASCTGPHQEITRGEKAASVTRPPRAPTAWSQPLLTKPLGRGSHGPKVGTWGKRKHQWGF